MRKIISCAALCVLAASAYSQTTQRDPDSFLVMFGAEQCDKVIINRSDAPSYIGFNLINPENSDYRSWELATYFKYFSQYEPEVTCLNKEDANFNFKLSKVEAYSYSSCPLDQHLMLEYAYTNSDGRVANYKIVNLGNSYGGAPNVEDPGWESWLSTGTKFMSPDNNLVFKREDGQSYPLHFMIACSDEPNFYRSGFRVQITNF